MQEHTKKGIRYFTNIIMLNILYVKGLEKKNGLIYILLWTTSDIEPFKFLSMKQESFVSKECVFQNCFVTNDRNLFDDVTKFDVIMFNMMNLGINVQALPPKRSIHQRYVFVALYPAGYHQISGGFNGFFNLTWTYKLSSNVSFTHMAVKNKHDKIIGPKMDMHWIDVNKMKPTSNYVIHKLRHKKIAAMWIASNCFAKSNRHNFVEALQRELKKYNHRIDIFGNCGNMDCPSNDRLDECYALIESDYYFYLAFENSLSEDYVTEKVCHALEHFAVPVVFGGANYTRFMPDGIYLNARFLEPEALAFQMNDIISKKNKYYDFFKWHRYYSFHETSHDNYKNAICSLCALLNDVKKGNITSVYMDIYEWWNGSPDVAHWAEPVVTEKSDEIKDTFKIVNGIYDSLFGL